MIPLLDLPDEVTRANYNDNQTVFSAYESENWTIIDSIPVSKNSKGGIESTFKDDLWDFTAYVDGKISYKNKLIFSDLSCEKLKRECKLVCYCWLYAAGNARKNVNIKPSTVFARHSKLMFTYKYLDKAKLKTIDSLSNNLRFNLYCQHIKKSQLSTGSITLILNAINHIERLSKIAPIQFRNPYKGTNQDLIKTLVVETDSGKSEQFFAIPTRLMEKCYSYCISKVEQSFEYREDIHDAMIEMRENYMQGKRIVDKKIDTGIWNWITKDSDQYKSEVSKHKPNSYDSILSSYFDGHPLDKEIPRDAPGFYGWISELQTCCFILCAAFTGMRRSEVYSLHSNSYKSHELFGKKYHTLESTYFKMTQSLGVTAEWITIPFTEKVIGLAEAISRNMRHQLMLSDNPLDVHKSSCLWLGQSNKRYLPKVRREGNMRNNFDKIAKKSGMTMTKEDITEFKLINPNCSELTAQKKLIVGNLWSITAHQFRRTFAVFAKRHNLCSSIAIKQQFKHLDLPTSEWYGEGGLAARLGALHEDKELGALLSNVVIENKTQKIHSWYNSEITLFGKMGQSLVRERASLPQIYKDWDVIYEHVKDGRLDVVGTLHAYCMAGYECKMSNMTSPANCQGCENQIVDEENAFVWGKRRGWCIKMLEELDENKTLTQSIYSHLITQVRAAEKIMTFFKIEHKPFLFKGNFHE
ncbi:integrase [Glaciecola siphonariae]|uniref:Integrase n=1 Tax=Glaciecola siphonariae TaxID=521012 RepID=A0ABV9LW92_9ALTE